MNSISDLLLKLGASSLMFCDIEESYIPKASMGFLT